MRVYRTGGGPAIGMWRQIAATESIKFALEVGFETENEKMSEHMNKESLEVSMKSSGMEFMGAEAEAEMTAKYTHEIINETKTTMS